LNGNTRLNTTFNQVKLPDFASFHCPIKDLFHVHALEPLAMIQNTSAIRGLKYCLPFHDFSVFAVNRLSIGSQLGQIRGLNFHENILNHMLIPWLKIVPHKYVKLIPQRICNLHGISRQRSFEVFLGLLSHEPMPQLNGFAGSAASISGALRNAEAIMEFPNTGDDRLKGSSIY